MRNDCGIMSEMNVSEKRFRRFFPVLFTYSLLRSVKRPLFDVCLEDEFVSVSGTKVDH